MTPTISDIGRAWVHVATQDFSAPKIMRDDTVPWRPLLDEAEWKVLRECALQGHGYTFAQRRAGPGVMHLLARRVGR